MIEIIAVVLLCSVNSKNAKARGKSGGAAVGYTLGMWFGAEILVAIIGIAVSGGEVTPAIYIVALLFAVGGGIGSYFIARSGTVVTQNQPYSYPPPLTPQNMSIPNQQPQPVYDNQQAQPLPPQPGQQPVYTEQQVQPLPPQPGQQPVYTEQQVQPLSQQPVQPEQLVQAQEQSGTATIVFSAKKVMGQFLVSSVTVEVNGVPYQTGFNQPIHIPAPAGNVQIECYLNYMGKSGAAQMQATLAPHMTYQLAYKSPMVVTGSGTLTMS